MTYHTAVIRIAHFTRGGYSHGKAEMERVSTVACMTACIMSNAQQSQAVIK